MKRWVRALVNAIRTRRSRSGGIGVCPPVGTGWNLVVRKALRRRLGIDLHRARPPGQPHITKSTLLFELDESFTQVVAEGVARSGSGPSGDGEGPSRHSQRLYNLAQMVDFTAGVEGLIVECGCYRGLSSYVVCSYLRAQDSQFDGETFHIFDSFEGLSTLTSADGVGDPRIPIGKAKRRSGMFAATVEEVLEVLGDFPAVQLHRGWIPESFAGVAEASYRFVHIDVDLHDPTRAALEYFYPRLSAGGVIVCDDFGSIRWPGAREAVESFCRQTDARLLRMSSGQALIIRPPNPSH